jgi:hypothetical protein
MSKIIDLGPVAPVLRGDWSSTETYERFNIVRHASATWFCNVNSVTGSEPSDSNPDWVLQVRDMSLVSSVNGQRGEVIIDSIETPAVNDNSTKITNTAWVTAKVNDSLATAQNYADLQIQTVTDSLRSTINADISNAVNSAITSFDENLTDNYATKDSLSETVSEAVSALVGSAPEDLNTLNELATALKTNSDTIAVLNAAISTKANDSEVMHNTGNETITGSKTFNSIINGSISGSSDYAAKDGAGNIITDTYATKTEMGNKITGPSSSVANRIVVFSDTSGKLVKDSGYTIATSVPANAVFTDTKYTLPNATSSTLGGVKLGSNISVSSGTISLSKANVTNALGYTPPSSAASIGIEKAIYTGSRVAGTVFSASKSYTSKTAIYTFPNNYFGYIKARADQDSDAWAKLWLGSTQGSYIDDSGGWEFDHIYIPKGTVIYAQNEKFIWDYTVSLSGFWF